MRESRGVQCAVESRFVSCDEPVARALIAKWQKIATPATLPAGGTAPQPGTVGLFLDEDQVAQFLKAGDNDQKLAEIGAPRITLFNGQRAYVLIATSRRYISGYAAVTAPGGQIRYEPVTSVVETGLLLDVQATVGPDRKSVALALHPQVSELLGMKQLPWIGRPTGSNLAIQDPQVRSTELRTTVDVPNGRTLLIGGLEDPRIPDGSAAEARANRPLRSLFLLVKPTPILGTAVPTKSAPLKTSRLRAPEP
jgi:type II secretory pathway component HofQ